MRLVAEEGRLDIAEVLAAWGGRAIVASSLCLSAVGGSENRVRLRVPNGYRY